MAQRKRPSRVRPKSPARVRKKKRERRQRGHQHHELLGLGLLAAGLFLAFVTWLEGNGGIVGTTIAGWLDELLGSARIGVPLVLVALGATAAQALLGRSFRVTLERGVPVESDLAPHVLATVRPSSILRAPDEAARRDAYDAFVTDLRNAARLVGAAEPRK